MGYAFGAELSPFAHIQLPTVEDDVNTVTNVGPGDTNVDQWSDTIWFTLDQNRPHPGHGDILLATVTRPQPPRGLVGTQADAGSTGYDVEVDVTIPQGLQSGLPVFLS